MLKAIQKVFNSASAQEVKEEMKTQDITENLAAEAAELLQVKEALASKDSELVAMLSQFEDMEKELASLKEIKADMEAKAASAKLSARKDKIVAAVGTEKADALMAATAQLEDAPFDAVIDAMVGKLNTEANSEFFKDVGVSAPADTEKLEHKPLHFNTFIKKENK